MKLCRYTCLYVNSLSSVWNCVGIHVLPLIMIYIYIYIYVYVYMCICIYVCMCMCMCVRNFISRWCLLYDSMRLCICGYAYYIWNMHVYVHVCTWFPHRTCGTVCWTHVWIFLHKVYINIYGKRVCMRGNHEYMELCVCACDLAWVCARIVMRYVCVYICIYMYIDR
jgi:hypothetical protein